MPLVSMSKKEFDRLEVLLGIRSALPVSWRCHRKLIGPHPGTNGCVYEPPYYIRLNTAPIQACILLGPQL
jgi:hypothetical protein